jgi:transposase-like protein
MNELKHRGPNVLIAIVDRLRSLPSRKRGPSRGDRYGVPWTTVQTCIIHLIGNSLAFVSRKDRKSKRRRQMAPAG